MPTRYGGSTDFRSFMYASRLHFARVERRIVEPAQPDDADGRAGELRNLLGVRAVVEPETEAIGVVRRPGISGS